MTDNLVNPDQPVETGRWRRAAKAIAAGIVYMVPLFWLWGKADYPESFGFRITAHGKAGVIEEWWYSYHLVERHHFWDVVTFVYMWAAVAGFVAWIGWQVWKDRKVKSGDTEATP